jgi:AcrR family transcriptional regulator
MSITTIDTESKIKEAARKIFQQKGFAATKTRDIAEESGINLALLNYYFRSKKKLYDLIMLETIHSFFGSIAAIMNNNETSFREKLELLVDRYIDIVSENPSIPLFIINEVNTHPQEFASKLTMIETIKNSVFLTQFKEEIKLGHIQVVNPIHFLLNLSSLVIFPFLASPLVMVVTKKSNSELREIILERKQLIPIWIEQMFKSK